MHPAERIARVLAELATVSEVSASRIDPSKGGGGNKPSSRPPTGSYRSLAEEWVKTFDLMAAVAEHELAAIRLGLPPTIDRDARIAHDYAGMPVAFVALVERCSPRHVERVRSAAGLNGATGRPSRPVKADPMFDAIYGEDH